MDESNETKPIAAMVAMPEAMSIKSEMANFAATTDQQVSAEASSSAAIMAALTRIADEVGVLRENVAAAQTRLLDLEAVVNATAKQVTQFLPPQMRTLGSKIDGLANSISEPKYRAVLLGLLSIYDLVDQVLRALPAPRNTGDADHRRNYEVLRTQLRQILETNGLSEISVDGVFDPQIHHALKRQPVADPAQADRVLEVVRPGFRTEQFVLRYADVVVGQYEPTETDEDVVTDDSSKSKALEHG